MGHFFHGNGAFFENSPLGSQLNSYSNHGFGRGFGGRGGFGRGGRKGFGHHNRYENHHSKDSSDSVTSHVDHFSHSVSLPAVFISNFIHLGHIIRALHDLKTNDVPDNPAPPPVEGPTETTYTLDPDKSDFKGKMSSFSDNGITVSVTDDDYDGGNVPGTMVWMDTGHSAAGFGFVTWGHKGGLLGKILNWLFGKGDQHPETVNVALDQAADMVTVSLVAHGSKHKDQEITFRVVQESGDITEVTMILDADAPDRLTDFVFNAEDYGDGSLITEIQFYSDGGHPWQIGLDFLIHDIVVVVKSDEPPPEDDEVIVVGNNVDDDDDSTLEFLVSDGVNGDPFGIIEGGDNHDILVGDAGGSFTLIVPPITLLNTVGNDVIDGAEGNDIIFGDSMFTDDLADDHGLGTDPGLGWEVFFLLELGASTTDPDWAREDTLDYIRNNTLELMQESMGELGDVRVIGNDTLNGGLGDDMIFGQEGVDMITGGFGDDLIYGGSGADVIIFESIMDGLDSVMDFDAADGDALDLSALLGSYDPLQNAINDFIQVTESGGNTTVSVDTDGAGLSENAVDLVVLEGVSGVDVSDWVDDGTIMI